MSKEKTSLEQAIEQAKIAVSLENTVKQYDKYLVAGATFPGVDNCPKLKEWGEASASMVGFCRNYNSAQNKDDDDGYVNPQVWRLLLDMSLRGNPHAIRELSCLLQGCIRADDSLKLFKAAVDRLVTRVSPCGDANQCGNHYRVNFDYIGRNFKDYLNYIKIPCVAHALGLPETDFGLRGRSLSTGSSTSRDSSAERSLSPTSKFALELQRSRGAQAVGGSASNPIQIPGRGGNRGGVGGGYFPN